MKTIFLKGLCGLSLVMVPKIVLSSSMDNLKSVSSHQYTHLIETYQSQTFEPLSQTALFLEQSASENTYKTAGVYFITNSKGQVFRGASSDNSFDDPSGKQCTGEGFNLTSCNGTAYDFCPYNDGYFKTCCDASYKYSKPISSGSSSSSSSSSSGTFLSDRYGGVATRPSVSGALVGLEPVYMLENPCSYPQTLSEKDCGGLYRCECSASTFPTTICNAPMVSTRTCSDSLGTHYSDCTCPTSVETPFGCKDYYDRPCDYVCKEAYEDTCHLYEGKGVKAPYGCQEYFEGCDTICKVAYTDGCHKYEDALDSCPIGAWCKYYADCSSKIQSWGCRGFYVQSDNACLLPLPVLYGDGTVSKEYPLTNKTAIGIVFDEENHLAVALTQVKKDGTPGFQIIQWATTLYNIPNLEDCTAAKISEDIEAITCGVDGRANTDAILACGEACGETPAATACNLYEPLGCTKDFCKKGRWFLPSLAELRSMVLMMEDIDKTQNELTERKSGTTSGNDLWSSTEASKNGAWLVDPKWSSVDGHTAERKYRDKSNGGVPVVRPFIKYED